MMTRYNPPEGLPAIPDWLSLDDIAALVGSIKETDQAIEDLGAYETLAAEDEVYHYVRNGDVEGITRMQLPARSTPITGVDEKAHLRYLLVALNAICLHAAISGGVSQRIGYGLNIRLSERIVSASTVDELKTLFESRIIPLSYGMLVHELSMPGITDKDIVKAIRFIHDHHHEKITTREIASHVGLSPEYFSAKFKRETGITVSAYIAEKRIEEAKALLRFSDYSIGEIAAQLAYSSQSYFQTAFRRETGLTPQQYRQSAGGANITNTDARP